MLTTLALLVIYTAQAQLPKLNTNAVTGGANAGQLLTQFISAIKPSSFTSAFSGANKEGLLSKAKKAASAVDIASTVSSLAGYIKPDMFKQGTTAKSIMDMGSKVTTMTQAAGLLKSFEGGLKPDALSSTWASIRPGWLTALNQLK
jgi:hypothetical protein